MCSRRYFMSSIIPEKIRPQIKAWLHEHPAVNHLAHKGVYLKNRFLHMCSCLRHPVKDNVAMFIAFQGRSYCCSPKAIYEYMINDSRFDDWTLVWIFRKNKDISGIPQLERAKIVTPKSAAYFRYYASAKYIISNYKYPRYAPRRKNQVFLQCWHGTPLKRLGFDIKDDAANARDSRSTLHKQYEWMSKVSTHFISPSAFASEKFDTAFKLREIKPETEIVEQGYPRNDYMYNFTPEQAAETRRKLGIPEDKKVILYAPTWRDNQHQPGVGFTYETKVDFDRLREALGDEYVILFRAHYLVASEFDFENYKGFVWDVSGLDDINELYVISDMLITDYSSVFFDYANLRRPIIFYMYDLELYRDDIRGFYMTLEGLPGPIVRTGDELIETICSMKNADFYDERYKAFNEKYNYLDDGKAAERVIKTVMGI